MKKLIEYDKTNSFLNKYNGRLGMQPSERYLINSFWIDPVEDKELELAEAGKGTNLVLERALATDPTLIRHLLARDR